MDVKKNNKPSKSIPETTWKPVLQNDEFDSKQIWSTIYKVCFKTIADNYIIWFQYKVLYNILGTKKYLHKLKISSDQMCSLCSQYPESIEHLFSECGMVSHLWENVQNWIVNKLGLNIILSKSMKILGYLQQDNYFWPLNFVLIITRNYIFQSSRKKYALNIFALQIHIKNKYLEQQMLHKISWKEHHFNRKWNIWGKLFDEI